MLNVKEALDATIISLKAQGVAPVAVTLNLVHRTLLAGQLKSAGMHDGIPEHLKEYAGMPVRVDASPSGQSAMNGRRPGMPGPVSQLLVAPAW